MSVEIYDFLQFTRDKRVVGRKQLLNETSKGSYFFLSRMMKNATKKFKGGKKLVDFVQMEDVSNGGYYNPLSEFNVTIHDGTVPITVPWAYHERHYAVVDEAEQLNDGDEDALVDYVMSLEQGTVVGAANDWEEACWALPNKETMEDTAAQNESQSPYSFLALVTRDGLAPSSGNGGLASGSSAWTTVQTINPTNYSAWRNQTETYSAADPNSETSGLINAFDNMYEKVGFEMPDILASYAESEEKQKRVIATNTEGIPMYKAALRAVNDRMAMLNDPSIQGPQYEGVPLKRVSQLDDAGWTAGQPDYLHLNLGFACPFVHTGTFFREKITPGGVNHPNKTVVFKFTWHNTILRSRRRQGRISAA